MSKTKLLLLFLSCAIPAGFLATSTLSDMGYFRDPKIMNDPYGLGFVLIAGVWYLHFAMYSLVLGLFVGLSQYGR